ncbi:chitinase-3-like protein 1 [Ornithodoros turicata]|uniref:chitinase-3-like protein 1 n=1 Tax=Ornithodoros turicata TaxID=34597 RepID=UPI00313988E1
MKNQQRPIRPQRDPPVVQEPIPEPPQQVPNGAQDHIVVDAVQDQAPPDRLPVARIPTPCCAPPFDISSSMTVSCLVLALVVMFTLALALQVYLMHSTTYHDGLVFRAYGTGPSYGHETSPHSNLDDSRETLPPWKVKQNSARDSVTARPYVYWNTRGRHSGIKGGALLKHAFADEKTTSQPEVLRDFPLLPARDYKTERKSVCMFHADGAGRMRDGAQYTAWTFPYHICTHVVYCCVAISKDLDLTMKRYEKKLQESSLLAFAQLKHKNPYLRVLVGVGGEERDRVGFTKITNSISARQQFTASAVEWMRQRHFDGMILYWKYPFLDQKAKHVDLMRSLRDTLREVNLTVGIVVPLDDLLRDRFDMTELTNSMDDYTILVDPVDTHGPSYDATFVPVRDSTIRTYAGLFISTIQKESGKSIDGRYRLCYLLPVNGVTFTLEEPAQTQISSPTLGPGEPGASTDRPGYLSYDEVCMEPWEDSRRVNYGVVSTRGNQWVVYQNRTSLRELITALGLVTGSAKCLGVWDPSWDDFAGTCGEGPYPLTRAIFAKVVGHKVRFGSGGVF